MYDGQYGNSLLFRCGNLILLTIEQIQCCGKRKERWKYLK